MNAAAMVDQVVAIERSRGAKIVAALAIAAEVLGLPPRKVFSHHYQQPVRLTGTAETLRRFRDYLARDIERSEQVTAARRELLKAAERHDALALAVGTRPRVLVDKDQVAPKIGGGRA